MGIKTVPQPSYSLDLATCDFWLFLKLRGCRYETIEEMKEAVTKMVIKTVPHHPYTLDLAPCDFWLFPKLRGCCYETIEEMKEAVMKVIDTLTQEDFHGASQKLLEQYNKGIAAGGDYFEGD